MTVGWLALEEGALGKPAVGAGHDPLPADEPRVGHEALGHRFRVLDHGRGVGDDAGNEHPALRQRDILPHAPLVGEAGRGRLDRDGLGLDAQHEIHHVPQGEIVEVRPLPASPTEVRADQSPIKRSRLAPNILSFSAGGTPRALMLPMHCLALPSPFALA
jgi:hypothetical protein